MRLHEYQAKHILRQYGVPVPPGEVATSVDQVYRIASRIGKRVVLKAQVLTGGRVQAGGIVLANDAEEARQQSGRMLGVQIGGYPSAKLLVDEAIDIEQELYLGITFDRRLALPVIVASALGGVELADLAHDRPEHVYRVPIEPALGLRTYQVRTLAEDIGLPRRQHDDFCTIASGLYRAFVDCDATLVEANPLVIRGDGTFCCLNSKVVIDEHALYRQAELRDLRDESQESTPERQARRHGVTYVRLGGHVGCLSNGAGLAMATIDLLRSRGVRPANFVDVGRDATAEKVARGIELARNNSAYVIVVHVYCSITTCDEAAQGILRGCERLDPGFSLVVRLRGPDEEAGRDVLAEAAREGRLPPIQTAASLDEIADYVVAHDHAHQQGGQDG
jgi:succinyl-CoA synthetase beta subunit